MNSTNLTNDNPPGCFDFYFLLHGGTRWTFYLVGANMAGIVQLPSHTHTNNIQSHTTSPWPKSVLGE